MGYYQQWLLRCPLIGGAVLTCLVLASGGFDKQSARKERLPLVLGGAALGMNWVALFEAYRLLNVSLATLIYYVGPMLILLCSPILFHEKLTERKLIAGGIVAIGLINTGLAYLLYFSGLQKPPGQSVALLSYLDPVSALCFSALLLHEAMTPIQICGAILIIGGAMFGEVKRKE